MLLSEALDTPLPALTPRQLWQAIKTIGAFKHEMRQAPQWNWRRHPQPRVAAFAVYNKRIDELLVEHEARRRPAPTSARD